MPKSPSDLLQPGWSETLIWLKSLLSSQEFAQLKSDIDANFSVSRHGDLPSWLSSLNALPDGGNCSNEFTSSVQLGQVGEMPADQIALLRNSLEALIPWRKGPFDLFGINLDTEWRSDFKWARIQKHLKLESRTVLDIGCGNGYHLWRMLAQQPERLVGIDPSPRFVVQFYMLKHYYRGHTPIDLLPLRSEDMPKQALFDTLLSMGVLYHRKSPIDHLEEARRLLKPGGQLLLETLTLEGDENSVLVPRNRYAMMRNVWFIPSELLLQRMLERAGFNQVELVDTSVTTTDEQRRTDWMRFHSLADFLHPDDISKTREGYPRPRRSVMIATAKER